LSDYKICKVNGHAWHEKLDPLYRRHYAEMQTRLKADGVAIGDYNPRLQVYFDAMDRGDMLTFIVLDDETVIGYSNIWLTNDMHNGDLIAQEDTIFVEKEHRNGIGRKLASCILDELRGRAVKRVHISPVTDLRVGKIWERMGFKPIAQIMTYNFEAE